MAQIYVTYVTYVHMWYICIKFKNVEYLTKSHWGGSQSKFLFQRDFWGNTKFHIDVFNCIHMLHMSHISHMLHMSHMSLVVNIKLIWSLFDVRNFLTSLFCVQEKKNHSLFHSIYYRISEVVKLYIWIKYMSHMLHMYICGIFV